MATVKRVNTDYTIQSINNDDVIIDAGELRVNGNLVVIGDTTTVTTTETAITDNIITLNSGETGSGITLGNAGIAVDRGLLPGVALAYNEITDTWQLSNDGTTFANIAVVTSGTTFAVIDDPAPELGANLNTSTFAVYSSADTIQFDSKLQINHTTGNVANVANSVIVYSSVAGSGGTGIYVSNEQTQNDELVSKRKATVFSIIF